MKTVVGMYADFDNAQQAVHALADAGFRSADINMIAGDEQGRYSRYLNGNVDERQDVGGGAATGAGIGAVMGGLGGFLLGLGALAIPGIGPVIAAGPIVAALAGAGVGAVAGGLVGALVDLGIPEEHAHYYEDGIKAGRTLVAVQTDDVRAEEASLILNRFHPMDVNQRSELGSAGLNTEKNMDTDMRPPADTNLETSRHQPTMPMTPMSPVMPGMTGMPTAIPVTGELDMDTDADVMDADLMDTDLADNDVDLLDGQDIHYRGPVITDSASRSDRFERQIPHTGTPSMPDVDVHSALADGWDQYDSSFQQDYQTRYPNGGNYASYQPAYRYGYDLAKNDQYTGYDWDRLEPYARESWASRGMQGRWEDVKDAVRHAWQSVTAR